MDRFAFGLKKKGIKVPKGYEEDNPLEPLEDEEELVALGTEPMEDLEEAEDFNKVLKEPRTRLPSLPKPKKKGAKRKYRPPKPDSEMTRKYLEAWAGSTDEPEGEKEEEEESEEGLFADPDDFASFF